MWIDSNVKNIGSNILDVNNLSILIDNLDYNQLVLQRNGPLSNSLVIHNKQYFSVIQKINNNDYTGIALAIHNLSYTLVEQIKDHYFKNYTILKSEVSICPPNTLQGFHIDPRVFHRISKRIHIPINTNSNSFLEIDDNRYFLDSKSIWEFNNLKMHRSGNLGTTYRTHIIVDFINNDTFNLFVAEKNVYALYEIYK